MRKLILPIAGILTCMSLTAAVVFQLAQPPKSSIAEPPTHQVATPALVVPPIQPQWGEPVRLSRTHTSPVSQSQDWQLTQVSDRYPDTAAPALQASVQAATTVQAPPAQTLGQPGIGFNSGIPNHLQTMPRIVPAAPKPKIAPRIATKSAPTSAPIAPNVLNPQSVAQWHQPAAQVQVAPSPSSPPEQVSQPRRLRPSPQFAQSYERQEGVPPAYQLATSLQLVGNYDDAIKADEDLLQDAGISPPANSGSTPKRLPAATPPTQTPATPATPPATTPVESLPKNFPAQSPPTYDPAIPSVTDSALPAATTPETPVTPQQTPATTPQTPASNGAWTKDTAPFPDEDLLQGETGELPPPKQTAPTNTNPPANSPINPPTQKDPSLPTTAPNKAPDESPFTTAGPKQPAPPANTRAPHAVKSKTPAEPIEPGVDPHLELYSKNCFPSAKECKTCHEEIYEEWAGSSHAYASISPMFQKFEQTIHALSMGTISHFCMRCHAPVATALAHPREASIWDSVPAAREGVTCIACHRVNEDYGKVNGERRVEMGDIHQPMYGSGYGRKLAEMIENKASYKIKPEPGIKGPGQNIHGKVIHFDQISDSSFCVSCHQVAVTPGIALEVVWAQYRASPACKQGITCQECHMGREPGVAAGYTTGPVAKVNGKDIDPFRKHSNHMFYGPGYSIAHPGLFPHEEKAEEWNYKEWLQFDYRAGWGTEKFEELVDDEKIDIKFPAAWSNADDRADAREVVDLNLQRLEEKRHMRHRLMENGSHLEGPIFKREPMLGRPLQFHYDVTNTNPGHNMPSGSLGAQPQVWLNVVLTGPGGQHLWESGYVDRNGDIADLHSLEVAAGRIRRDLQLFNLQTKFLITGIKGTDREMYLPINTDADQLPFIRQSGFPVSVMNHPPTIRMEAHSVPPLATMKAKYKVPADLVQRPGVYRLSVRMRSRAEPIYFMRFCKATSEMERNMNHWMLDYHEESFQFMVQ